MILLHAIVPREVSSVPDPGLRSHEAGNVAVLYEETESPPPSDRPAVLEHGRRVVALAERVPLLPVRYGTTLAGVEELRTVVEEHADAWSRSLARLAGRCELVVHLDLAEAPHDKRPEESGGAYLLRRTEVVRRQDRALDEARAAVGPWTEETRLLNDRHRLAVLLARADADAACEAVAAWAQDCDDLDVLVTGPWPPFSFCEQAGLA